MRLMTKRLARLEVRMGVGPETPEQQRAREAVETLRRRINERLVRQGLPPRTWPAPSAHPGKGNLSIIDILRAGRRRCAEGAAVRRSCITSTSTQGVI
jgi:hypothetical protein